MVGDSLASPTFAKEGMGLGNCVYKLCPITLYSAAQSHCSILPHDACVRSSPDPSFLLQKRVGLVRLSKGVFANIPRHTHTHTHTPGQFQLQRHSSRLDHLLSIKVKQSLRLVPIDSYEVVILLHPSSSRLATWCHLTDEQYWG